MADLNTHSTVQQPSTGHHPKTPSFSTKRHPVVLIGGRDVGKSALGARYEQGVFYEQYDSQLSERDADARKLVSVDDETVVLEIHDVDSGPAGTKDIRTMREKYMRHGDGFILVYSVADRDSFQEILEFQEHIGRVKGLKRFPAILVGNKCDLENERQVSVKEGRETAERLGFRFFETSAKLPVNVDEAFAEIVREIRRQTQEHPSSRTHTLNEQVPVMGRAQVDAHILQDQGRSVSPGETRTRSRGPDAQGGCFSGCIIA